MFWYVLVSFLFGGNSACWYVFSLALRTSRVFLKPYLGRPFGKLFVFDGGF